MNSDHRVQYRTKNMFICLKSTQYFNISIQVLSSTYDISFLWLEVDSFRSQPLVEVSVLEMKWIYLLYIRAFSQIIKFTRYPTTIYLLSKCKTTDFAFSPIVEVLLLFSTSYFFHIHGIPEDFDRYWAPTLYLK